MTSPVVKLAGVILGSIGTLVFAVPYGGSVSPTSPSCASAKAAALVALAHADPADFRRRQVEVKNLCLAAAGIALGDTAQ